MREELREAKKELKRRERELARKEKALAEMAALLAFQKKKQRSCWGKTSKTDRAGEAGTGVRADRGGVGGGRGEKKNPRALTEEERAEIVRVCCSEIGLCAGGDCGSVTGRRGISGPCMNLLPGTEGIWEAASSGQHSDGSQALYPAGTESGRSGVYSWDITWLPSTVRGLFWYCYSYHAAYPGRFGSVEEAREWMGGFIDWYNTVHRHLGIRFVTPEQRRRWEDTILFEKRNQTFLEAWERLKQRFPKTGPKLWEYKRVVYLNPSQETRNYLWRKAS